MKTLSTLLLALALVAGAGSPVMAQTAKKTAATAKKAATTTGIAKSEMTDARCLGLYGPVKTVKITSNTNGETQVTTYKFNAKGQLTSATKWGNTETYTWSTDTKYKKGSTPVVITYGKNKRVDTEDVGESLSTTYIFNANGQLTTINRNMWLAESTSKYLYKTTSDKLPYKESSSGIDEGDEWSNVENYQYLSTDSHGNWTKRKVNGKYTETQVITYY